MICCCNRLLFAESRRSDAGGAFFRWLHRTTSSDSQSTGGTINSRPLADEYRKPVLMVGGTGGGVGKGEGGDESYLMTIDEWCARGVELALLLAVDAAEQGGEDAYQSVTGGASAEIYLRKGFNRAGNASLRSRAEAQLDARSNEIRRLHSIASVQGSEEKGQFPPQPLSIPEEVAVASIMLRCLRAGVWSEAAKLSGALLLLNDRLEVSEHFERDVHRVLTEKVIHHTVTR